MKFILGKKAAMSRAYRADGTVVSVTNILAGPCVVTQIKDPGKNGYAAVQVGFGSVRRLRKPIQGHLRDLGQFRWLREFRLPAEELSALQRGDRVTAATFAPGDVVKVVGISKGRGFQGVVKRHHFAGQPKTHGHKDQLRRPGSSGAGGVQRVRPGKRMPGRMGGQQVTVTNLEVMAVDPATQTLAVHGAIPGSRNSLVLISGPGQLKVERTSPAPDAPLPAVPAPVDARSLPEKI